MVTQMITLKLEHNFLNELDELVKNSGYQNRTEFIRNAVREKIEEEKMKKFMMDLSKQKGSAKRKINEEELEKVREEAFEELYSKIK